MGMIEKNIPVERIEHVINVFGSFDQNLRIIESEYGVKVINRDEQLRISGDAESVMLAEKAINGLLNLAAKGEEIDSQNVRYIIKLVGEGRENSIPELARDVVCVTAKASLSKPRPWARKRMSGPSWKTPSPWASALRVRVRRTLPWQRLWRPSGRKR